MSDIKLSPKAKAFRLGRYRHYKGHEYKVLGIGIHSETLEELVIYKSLYGEGLIWLRPIKMFFETVEVDGKTQPRFKYLGK
jgi:hypothetical protein